LLIKISIYGLIADQMERSAPKQCLVNLPNNMEILCNHAKFAKQPKAGKERHGQKGGKDHRIEDVAIGLELPELFSTSVI